MIISLEANRGKSSKFYYLFAAFDAYQDGGHQKTAVFLCAEHVRQLGGASPLPSLMEAKG